ncbi:MAG: helix-turn-helix domain-containing protein [Clostridiales bacterium]|jgi:transcriptional regulator with XRE-family HTH domain|nr:helix-turn-helix domain-containing protein [Clostridiales bacterium]
MDIKKRLIEEINNSGMTTVELSKKVGVSPEMITQYKTTKKMPSLTAFAKLCEALDISADYILGLKNY